MSPWNCTYIAWGNNYMYPSSWEIYVNILKISPITSFPRCLQLLFPQGPFECCRNVFLVSIAQFINGALCISYFVDWIALYPIEIEWKELENKYLFWCYMSIVIFVEFRRYLQPKKWIPTFCTRLKYYLIFPLTQIQEITIIIP